MLNRGLQDPIYIRGINLISGGMIAATFVILQNLVTQTVQDRWQALALITFSVSLPSLAGSIITSFIMREVKHKYSTLIPLVLMLVGLTLSSAGIFFTLFHVLILAAILFAITSVALYASCVAWVWNAL